MNVKWWRLGPNANTRLAKKLNPTPIDRVKQSFNMKLKWVRATAITLWLIAMCITVGVDFLPETHFLRRHVFLVLLVITAMFVLTVTVLVIRTWATASDRLLNKHGQGGQDSVR